LVADASSDILSRPMDVTKYGVIYGCAQKNAGTAGVTFVIIREDLLGKVSHPIPTMMDYRNHIKEGSLLNTPPVFPIFIMTETLKWLKAMGGVEEIHKINVHKAALLYNEIDRNQMFTGTAEKEDRSLMNARFVMNKGFEDKEEAFLEFSKECGIKGIKGHRLVGGFRASIYNACPIESVYSLISCMQDFELLYK
jgi:phosphoserine aminotransferase